MAVAIQAGRTAVVADLLWIVPVALFVLVEKCMPLGEQAGKVGGALLIAWGAAALYMAF